MRILIVGAGIAGLTLAALLIRRGIYPKVIESAKDINDAGYMIGLYPIGSNILHGLGCYDQFLKESVAIRYYRILDGHGQLLNEFNLEKVDKKFGVYRALSRGDHIKILYEACHGHPIEFSTTLTEIKQKETEVEVTYINEEKETFDLVVGADGIHSKVRSLILKPNEIEYFDSGWGGWVWWVEEKKIEEVGYEYWGSGQIFTTLPVKGKLGCFALTPYPNVNELQGGSRKKFILNKFSNFEKQHPEYFKNLPDDNHPLFFWPFADIKTKTWIKGRVVLIGDAATAFLPSVGAGASMAMESAAVLNDILSRSSSEQIPLSLDHYVRRREKRVELMQRNARRLSKALLIKNPLIGSLRNWLIRFQTTESMAKKQLIMFDQPV